MAMSVFQRLYRSAKSSVVLPNCHSYSKALYHWRLQNVINTDNASRLSTKSSDVITEDKGDNLQTDAEIVEDEPALVQKTHIDTDLLEELLLRQQESDMPLTDMSSPYKKLRRICFLCKHDIKLDYKNVQLLSQFTSPYTGRIYGRNVTGLCIPMQKRMAKLIQRSRVAGFMPFRLKEITFLTDPKLFDPFRPGKKKEYY